MITITIPGTMRGKGRPRFSTQGGFARAYTDAQTASAETWVKCCAIDQVGLQRLPGPLSLSIKIAVEVPRSWTKKRRELALGRAAFPTGKPDLDNVVKLLGDSLNGIVWVDDSQIVRIDARKFFADVAGTVLEIAEV